MLYIVTLYFSFLVELSTALLYHVGQKFDEVCQLKQGKNSNLSSAKILEMMKTNNLDVDS